MDFQNQPYENKNYYQNRRSPSMAAASLVLGIISLAASACILPGIVCGSLGMILALLSRGGTKSMDNQATLGFCLSCAALLFTITITVTNIFIMYQAFGGWDGILREYMNMLGVDTTEELYQMLGIY